MSSFRLKVSTPNGNVFDGDVYKIVLRAAEGELAVLAGHIPFVSSVKACDCKIEFSDGSVRIGATDAGILTVDKESSMLIVGNFNSKE